jgi:hypothetical protein
MTRTTPFVVALLLAWNPTPIHAQSSAAIVLPGGTVLGGSPQEQAACAGDAHRYCRDAIPDNFRVLACLKDERVKISRPCRSVLEAHGQ